MEDTSGGESQHACGRQLLNSPKQSIGFKPTTQLSMDRMPHQGADPGLWTRCGPEQPPSKTSDVKPNKRRLYVLECSLAVDWKLTRVMQ